MRAVGKGCAVVLMMTLATLVGVEAKADDSVVIYREVFNVPDPSQGDPSGLTGPQVAAAQGWLGFRNGGSFSNGCSVPLGQTCLQAFGESPTRPQPPSVGNPPVFQGPGNAFWSPQVTGVTIYTEETPLPVDLIRRSTISFETKHNQDNSNNRLALRIADTWFMSNQAYTHGTGGSTWQSNVFDQLDTAFFGSTPVVTSCNTPPCGPFKPASFTELLPTEGVVDALGIFVDGTNANHRFDRYTVTLDLTTFPNQGQCISTLIRSFCDGLTGRDRQACNRQQQRACRAAF